MVFSLIELRERGFDRLRRTFPDVHMGRV